PIADAFKLIFKEGFGPTGAYKVIYSLAPVLTVIPALIITAVVPWGPPITIGGKVFALSLTDVNTGALYLLTVTSISVYGITLAGWSSNNKYSMMGGLRATAQMISYELALGMSYLGPILLAGSLSVNSIVNSQQHLWNVILQPVGAIIYIIAAIAEVNRAPFDMPEA
ncbi:NADH-quinone oxidoreductase subunit H, partial [bacterium]|nr:NADH-quinone oxidoreductase subunit H [bacterium]